MKDLIEDLPPYIDPELWSDFVQSRKEMKKPMTPTAQKRALKLLVKFQNEGRDPNESLERSIINGWRGVFPAERKQQADPVEQRAAKGYRLRLV